MLITGRSGISVSSHWFPYDLCSAGTVVPAARCEVSFSMQILVQHGHF